MSQTRNDDEMESDSEDEPLSESQTDRTGSQQESQNQEVNTKGIASISNNLL